ncbi:hypothetical protein [Peribacillus muralis]|uniref:hypothetical protein n=1 Tax=Peribacillus muralis TaxID=264697 RepID=UPI003D009DE1
MKVLIEDNLYIEGDERGIEIRKYTGKFDEKTEKEIFKNYGYFQNVSGAVKKILRMKMAESKATTLSELLEDVQRIEKFIEDKITV